MPQLGTKDDWINLVFGHPEASKVWHMIMSTPKPDGVKEDKQDRFQKSSMIRRNIFELVYTQWLKDEAAGPFLDEDAVYEEGFDYKDEFGKCRAYGLRNQDSGKPEGLVRLVRDYGLIREEFFKQGQRCGLSIIYSDEEI